MIIGVDPGLNGAIAILFDKGELSVYDMPTLEVKRGGKLKREISPEGVGRLLASKDYNPPRLALHAFVERVGAMPGQGVTSCFSFGYSTGVVIGALAALKIPVTIIPPLTWQKAVAKREGKDGSRQRAMELFPDQAGFFARVKDDGRADAALIAYYGCKNLGA